MAGMLTTLDMQESRLPSTPEMLKGIKIMCLPRETTTFKAELLCQAYRQDRLRLAKQERFLRSAKPNRSWQKSFSYAACKVLFYRLISPLYHRLKQRVEAAAI